MIRSVFAIFFLIVICQFWVISVVISEEDDYSSDHIIEGVEEHDAEVKLQNDLLNNYNKDVLPPHTPSSPIMVQFGTPIISVRELNAHTQILTTEFWIKMIWTDSRLTWNADHYYGIDEVKLPDHAIWQPSIQLLNSAKFSEMNSKSSSMVFVRSNGKVMWSPPDTVHTHCGVNLKHYPYDSHVCFFKFGSWTHHGYHIDVELDPNITEAAYINSWNTAGEWEIVGSKWKKTTSYFSQWEEPFPDVTFFLTLRRRSPLYKVVVLCPLISIVFFILASFWISPTSNQRITLNVVCFLALVLIVNHLAIRIPAVGSEVPVIMGFSGILIILTSILTITSVSFSSYIHSRCHNQLTPVWFNKILRSRVSKLFWISSISSFEKLSNPNEPQSTQNEEESTKIAWTLFFQFIDRIVFIIFLIIIVSVTIALAS